MDDTIRKSMEQAAAVQRMWMDSVTGMARVWGEYSPETPPPEEIKRLRKGMLEAISASWEDYMRTPQFMELMRESLNNAMTWQGLAKDGVNRVHKVMQTASKSDVDGILLAIRHVEKRLLDTEERIQASLDHTRLDLSRKTQPLAEQGARLKELSDRVEQLLEAARAGLSAEPEKATPSAGAAKPKASASTARRKAATPKPTSKS